MAIVTRFVYGLKSRINLGDYETKEIVVEYTLDNPTPEAIEELKTKVADEIEAEEFAIRERHIELKRLKAEEEVVLDEPGTGK